MFKKIATATILAGGLFMMGSSAFAFTFTGQYGGDDVTAQAYTSKHGTCVTQDYGRVCSNYNSSNK